MELEFIAPVLLIIRIVAIDFIFVVLHTQKELMKRPIDPEITGYRKTLYRLTLGLLASNIVPVIFDTFIVFKESGLVFNEISSTPILVAYAVSNALAALLAAYLISRIYKDAVSVDETRKKSDHTLMND